MDRRISVRPATDSDLDTLADFGAALARQHEQYDATRFRFPEPLEDAQRHFLGEQLANPNARLLVAADGPTLLGYAFVRHEEASFVHALAPTLWLHDLYVVPEARGSGAGKDLLAAAQGMLAEFATPSLMLSVAPANLTAIVLFVGAGFRSTMLEFRYDAPRSD